MARKYDFNPSTKRQHPSLLGVVAPALRFNAYRFPNSEKLILKPARRFEYAHAMFKKFQSTFEYKGKYHIPPHFGDVEVRFLESLKQLSGFGYKVDKEKIELAKIFAIAHDIVHNAGKIHPYYLTVTRIAKLYGFDLPNDEVLEEIKNSLNYGIQEDNDISLWEQEISARDEKFVPRKLIKSYNGKIDLSVEEMSAIVTDAILYKCGYTMRQRRIMSGLIQATEFLRSLTPEGNPGIKFPRTQYELIAKLADMGSFYGSIEEWLKLSVDFILEAAKDLIKTPKDFIEFGRNFLNNFVKPILTLKNLPPASNKNGSNEKAIVPPMCLAGIDEKLSYFETIINEFTKHGIDPTSQLFDATGKVLDSIREVSPVLADFLERIHQTLDPIDHEPISPAIEPVRPSDSAPPLIV